MSKSINRVFLLGHVGGDPVLRYTPTKLAVVQVSLATTEFRRNPQGDRLEITQWHSLVFLSYKNLADVASKYIVKGMRVHIEGRLDYYAYLDKTGKKRLRTQIIVDDLILLKRPEKPAVDLPLAPVDDDEMPPLADIDDVSQEPDLM